MCVWVCVCPHDRAEDFNALNFFFCLFQYRVQKLLGSKVAVVGNAPIHELSRGWRYVVPSVRH